MNQPERVWLQSPRATDGTLVLALRVRGKRRFDTPELKLARGRSAAFVYCWAFLRVESESCVHTVHISVHPSLCLCVPKLPTVPHFSPFRPREALLSTELVSTCQPAHLPSRGTALVCTSLSHV